MGRRAQYILGRLAYLSWPGRALGALRVLGLSVSPFVVYREPAPAGPAEAGEALRDVSLEFFGPDRIEELLNLPDRMTRRRTLEVRFERDDICLAARREGRVVGFSWANLRYFAFGRYYLELLDHEAYLYDAYVAPALRGQGLAHVLRASMQQHLVARGQTRFYSVTDCFNGPALRFKEKLGAEAIDAGIAVSLFGRWRFGTAADAARLRKAGAPAKHQQDEKKREERPCIDMTTRPSG